VYWKIEPCRAVCSLFFPDQALLFFERVELLTGNTVEYPLFSWLSDHWIRPTRGTSGQAHLLGVTRPPTIRRQNPTEGSQLTLEDNQKTSLVIARQQFVFLRHRRAPHAWSGALA
jgi:hypothetical protein